MGVARGKRPAPAHASPSLRPMRLRDGHDSPESWPEPLNYLYVQVGTTVSLLIRCVQRSTLTSHKSLKLRCCNRQMAYFDANHCQTSYCRSSLQMRYCAGGASLGGYGMPPAVQMKAGIGEPCESGSPIWPLQSRAATRQQRSCSAGVCFDTAVRCVSARQRSGWYRGGLKGFSGTPLIERGTMARSKSVPRRSEPCREPRQQPI